MDKVIEVKDLRISFRTNNGTVKAVRGIDFSVSKGETLAIVGESGSGKSVTARAIMGIQAGNSIAESGEIFYDGMDLVRIPEEDFHQLRGNRISMIFQDPFSSLNPIVRVGKQLTEAMILNGRANQRDAKRDFNKRIKNLQAAVEAAYAEEKKAGVAGVAEKMNKLRRFTHAGSNLEKAYVATRGVIEASVTDIDGVLIDLIRGNPKVIAHSVNEIIKNSALCYHKYLVDRGSSPLGGVIAELQGATATYVQSNDNTKVKELLGKVKEIYEAAMKLESPDFFAMGYYVTYNSQPIPAEKNIAKLNKITREYLETNFMNFFLQDLESGIKLSYKRSLAKKLTAIKEIEARLPLFDDDKADYSQYMKAAQEMSKIVENCIDKTAIVKDSLTYTFKLGIIDAVQTYIAVRKLGQKKKLSKKNSAFMAGRSAEGCRNNIRLIMNRICDAYRHECENESLIDATAVAKRTIEVLNQDASKMVYRVTKGIAKSRAIGLMEEVGIPEARARYRQYPFQLSGGMRQRVVIAIALAANPDLLICDEPTTALDVTIQAQILDLIKSLKIKRQLSVIFITHNLGVVANIADHIAVMYAGKIVEYGKVDEVFFNPAHPYTWALLSSMPDLETKEKLEAIPGTPPNMIFPPQGDAFAARNKYAMQIDFEEQPPFFELSPTHKAATWLLHPEAPKVEPPRIVTERIERMKAMEVASNG